MTKQIKETTATIQNTTDTFLDTGRDVIYAGLGVVAMLEEEVRDAFGALVREGKRAEKGRVNTLTAKAVNEIEDEAAEVERDVRQAGRKVQAVGKDVETRIVETVGVVLDRMNIPTRDDIESLRKSVDRLNKKALALRAG